MTPQKEQKIRKLIVENGQYLERLAETAHHTPVFVGIFGRTIGEHLAQKLRQDPHRRLFWLWPVLDTMSRRRLCDWLVNHDRNLYDFTEELVDKIYRDMDGDITNIYSSMESR